MDENAHIDVLRATRSESQAADVFSARGKEYGTEAAKAVSPAFAAVNDKVATSGLHFHDITLKDFSSMRLDGCRKGRLCEASIRSRSTLSRASIGTYVAPKNYLHFARAGQATGILDTPLLILERMAYDTAILTLNHCGMPSYSVTPPSQALTSDRGWVERSAPENQARTPHPLDRSHQLDGTSTATSPRTEVPLGPASAALSHSVLSEVGTCKSKDSSLQDTETAWPRHANRNRIDKPDYRCLTKDGGDVLGNSSETYFAGSTFGPAPLSVCESSKSDDVLLTEVHHNCVGELTTRESLSETHSAKLLESEQLLDVAKQRGQSGQMPSGARLYGGEDLCNEEEGCCDFSGLWGAKVRPGFLNPKSEASAEEFPSPSVRDLSPALQLSVPALTQWGDYHSAHRSAQENARSLTPSCAANNSNHCNKGAMNVLITSENAPSGTASSSLFCQKYAPTPMEPFQTWPFPIFCRSLSSPFQTPTEENLIPNSNCDGVEGFVADGECQTTGRGSNSLGLSPKKHLSPRLKLQIEHGCMDAQSGSFSSILGTAWNRLSRLPRVYNDSAPTHSSTAEEAPDIASQRLLGLGSGTQSRRNGTATLLALGDNYDIEFLRAWEMIYDAYMRNCSTYPCGGQRNSNDGQNSSFGSNRVFQPSEFDASNPYYKLFRGANSLDSHRKTLSHSALTPSTSVSYVLSRSAGYYTFGNRISLHHPNRQKVLSIPQCLASTPHVQTPSQGSTTHTVKEKLGGDAKLLQKKRHRKSMDPAVVTSIQRRPLLLTTVFLRYMWAFLMNTKRSNVDTDSEKRNDSTDHACLGSVSLSSNDANGKHSGITEGCAPVEQLSESLRGSTVGRTSKKSSSSNIPVPSLTACDENVLATATTAASLLDTFTPNYLPPRPHSGQCDEEQASCLATDSSGGKCLHRKVEASRSDYTYGVSHSLPLRLSWDGAQEPERQSSCFSPQKHHPIPLTHFEKLVRHEHPIDNLVREVDNESNDLVVYVGTRLMGWLEVLSLLGCGSFGQVFLCKDLRIGNGYFVHPSEIGGEDFAYWSCSHAYLPLGDCDIPPTHSPLVAVKVVKSIQLFEHQSELEAEMLVLIGAQTASLEHLEAASPMSQTQISALDPPPPDPRCTFVGKVLAHGVCYGHHCIVMERYGANLYEYVQSCQHRGLPMWQIRSIAKQLLSALTLLHEDCHIIHADIKPENLLLTLNSRRGMPKPASAAAAGERCLMTSCYTGVSTQSDPPAGQSLKESSRAQSVEDVQAAAPKANRSQTFAQQPFHPHKMLAATGVASQPQTVSSGCSISVETTAHGSVSLSAPYLQIKLIDFSSSCYDAGPFYTYIQSRYYRAPEVILNAGYGPPIDLWSTGCVLAELLLGMPLLPGCNDHHQLVLMEEMVGPLPVSLLKCGATTYLYYDEQRVEGASEQETQSGTKPTSANNSQPCMEMGAADDACGSVHSDVYDYKLVSKDEFLARNGLPFVEYRRYFTCKTLQELVRHCPLTSEEKRMSHGLSPYVESCESGAIPPNAKTSETVCAGLMRERFLLYDLLRQLLNTDSVMRPTAAQALLHPFLSSNFTYMQEFGLE